MKVWADIDYELTVTESGSSLIEISLSEEDKEFLLDIVALLNSEASKKAPELIAEDLLNLVNMRLKHKIKKIYFEDDKGQLDKENFIDVS